ncbi:MAG TPA: STAS domain-containing protein, partial [Polyangiaceae bacterium]|nr:STAS domain-containing protein [Polyangiaceae bacterium]
LQARVIEAQRHALRELSTPLIPIADDAVVMPLIGAIDSQRAQQLMEVLLDGVAAHRAATVIIDVTGVQVVDTEVADALVRASHAVKLLGAEVVLTGIRPEVARTLVQMDVDLGDIVVHGSLRDGIAYALGRPAGARSRPRAQPDNRVGARR